MKTLPTLVREWCPPREFLEWKKLDGAGLVIESYTHYAWQDFVRFMTVGVKTSARFIEERVRDDIRKNKRLGIRCNGYSLNSHLTKPILMHMLSSHPEWAKMFEVRHKDESELPHE